MNNLLPESRAASLSVCVCVWGGLGGIVLGRLMRGAGGAWLNGD